MRFKFFLFLFILLFPTLAESQEVGQVPLDLMDSYNAARVKAVLDKHTILRRVGPTRFTVSKEMYEFFIDHLDFGAAVARRLRLAKYCAIRLSEGKYYGDDGEGVKGTIELVYSSEGKRVYFSNGRFESRLFPTITGLVVVLLNYAPITDGGKEFVEQRFYAYIKIDQRVIALLTRILLPLLGNTLDRKIGKLLNVSAAVSERIHKEPGKLWEQLQSSNEFDPETLEVFKRVLGLLE